MIALPFLYRILAGIAVVIAAFGYGYVRGSNNTDKDWKVKYDESVRKATAQAFRRQEIISDADRSAPARIRSAGNSNAASDKRLRELVLSAPVNACPASVSQDGSAGNKGQNKLSESEVREAINTAREEVASAGLACAQALDEADDAWMRAKEAK